MQDDPNLNQNSPSTVNPQSGNDYSEQNPNPQTAFQPISNPAKEAAPFGEQIKPVENYAEISEKEPEIKPEVESAGVYKVSDKVKLDQEARSAGVTEAKESTPFVMTPNGKVSLPMDSLEANQKAKGNPNNSVTWLASIVQLFFKKLGSKNA